MWSIIKTVFGFDGVGESALKIVDKLAGTDWTPKEKAEYTLKFVEATKNRSQARRVIAYMVAFVWVIMTVSWLIATITGRYLYDETLNAGTVLAADISAYVDLNITSPFNLVLGFYFTMGVVDKLKK